MTTKEAIKVLMALACCSIGELHCGEDCPKCISAGVCEGWEGDEVIEAVKVLREMFNNDQ